MPTSSAIQNRNVYAWWIGVNSVGPRGGDKRVGVRADSEERRVAEVEEAAKPHDDVQTDREKTYTPASAACEIRKLPCRG